MTSKHIVNDKRYPAPDGIGGFVTLGTYETRDQEGQNRSSADRLAGIWPDHDYEATYDVREYGSFVSRYLVDGVMTDVLRSSGEAAVGMSFPSFSSNDVLALYSKAADKIQLHDWNAGVFVGELGKTVDLLSSRVRQLAQSLQQARKGNLGKAVELLAIGPSGFVTGKNIRPRPTDKVQTWYEKWLELRYAYRPLVKDIYDLSEAIRTLDVPRKYSFKVRIKKPGSAVNGAPFFFDVKGEGLRRLQLKCTIVEEPVSIAQHLGLLDPELVLHELTPFSFVADWFIPIGSYLKTRAILARAQGTSVTTETLMWDVRVTGIVPAQLHPAPDIFNRDARGGYSKRRWIKRTVASSIPTVPLPSFRNPLGGNPATRALDAIALLSAVVYGGSGRKGGITPAGLGKISI